MHFSNKFSRGRCEAYILLHLAPECHLMQQLSLTANRFLNACGSQAWREGPVFSFQSPAGLCSLYNAEPKAPLLSVPC